MERAQTALGVSNQKWDGNERRYKKKGTIKTIDDMEEEVRIMCVPLSQRDASDSGRSSQTKQ